MPRMKSTCSVIILILVFVCPLASAQPADWLLISPHLVKLSEMVAFDVYAIINGIYNLPQLWEQSVAALALGAVVGGPSTFLLVALTRDDAEVRTWRIVSL